MKKRLGLLAAVAVLAAVPGAAEAQQAGSSNPTAQLTAGPPNPTAQLTTIETMKSGYSQWARYKDGSHRWLVCDFIADGRAVYAQAVVADDRGTHRRTISANNRYNHPSACNVAYFPSVEPPGPVNAPIPWQAFIRVCRQGPSIVKGISTFRLEYCSDWKRAF